MNQVSQKTADAELLNQKICAAGLAPMWRRPSMPGMPPGCAPQSWNYQAIRSLLLEAAPLISHAESERRVLILESEGLRGSWSLSKTLFGGVQLLLPGEIAPAHRHSQAACRFVFEGSGAYASIDGERIPLDVGDLLVTPRWAWHDHGHEGEGPALWLDILDVPLVATVGAEFREWHGAASQPITALAGSSAAMYGNGLTPIKSYPASTIADAGYLKRYSYVNARAAVCHAMRSNDVDPWQAAKLTYTNPATGGPILPDISAFLQGVPKGFATRSYRSTETTLVVVAEGSAKVRTDGGDFDLGPQDMALLPSWCEHVIECKDESILFSVSNRPLLNMLGLWREEKSE